jgi:hypothetical protein
MALVVDWFAWANTEVPACIKIFVLVNSEVEDAISASLIREFAADKFSLLT